ncbi:MAG: toprim domain-containing protein [Fibrobacteria bacterium]|nr:toprim domain-containing protein [Fibrobacteria bacterium]
MIEKERIEAIKNGIDLKSYVESRGIPLKKNGKGYFGLCPFHDDNKTPSLSVNVSNNLWKCFGCGSGGDVIRFVELFDKVDFRQAVRTLDPGVSCSKKESPVAANPEQVPPKLLPEPKVQQLFDRVITIYEKNFDETGKQYLYDRGISDAILFERHRIGYCTGKLRSILPSKGDVLDDLTQIGVLNPNNNGERFSGCLTFPVFDLEGNITTIYGRFFHQNTKRHVFLPNRSTGIWNVNAVKTSPEIIIVESIIDALSVMTAGFLNVISIQGTNGFSEREIDLFRQYGVQKIILMLDGDEAGKKAIKQLKEKITGFTVTTKILPDNHDPNSFLMAHGAEALAGFIQSDDADNSIDTTNPDISSSLTAKAVQATQPQPNGFSVMFGLRKYQIIGLEKGARKLKSTVRVEHGGKLHVDTLDFYSARSRRVLAQDICRIFDEASETIEADITRLIRCCENAEESEKPEEQQGKQVIVKGKEEEKALEFGRSTDLINHILSDFETCGLIGEDANKLLGYVIMSSRKLQTPLAMLILASSGAGKTALQDAIVAFCPPEDLVKLTSLSGKALFYKEQTSLKHKVLALEEGDGAEDAFYAIRNLISSGVLVSESTIKDFSTGKLTTMTNEVEGPTGVFYTTTQPDTDPETKSRFFVTGIDESREQTQRILSFQRKKQTTDELTTKMIINGILQKHWNFQRLLKPLGIKNPYAEHLTYGDDRLQSRRDQPKYLNLIKSVAFLRQMQKNIKHEYKDDKQVAYVEVDFEDIRIANDLAHKVMGRSLDELSRPGRDLLLLLDDMVENIFSRNQDQTHVIKRTEIGFTRRDIREYSKWSNYRVHTHLKELVDLEYVLVESGRNGSQYRYCLAYEGQGKSGQRFVLGLKDVEDIKELANLSGAFG